MIISKTNQSEDDKEVLKYGITALILNLPKTIFLIFVAKKLKLLKPLCLIFAFYGTIRNFTYGIHAKNSWICFMGGMINSLSMAYLSTILHFPTKVYNAFYLYFFAIYLKYAPSGTETNPIQKDQVKRLKIISLAVITIYYFIGNISKGVIRNICLLALLSQSFSILPITFKLAKQKGGVVYDEE